MSYSNYDALIAFISASVTSKGGSFCVHLPGLVSVWPAGSSVPTLSRWNWINFYPAHPAHVSCLLSGRYKKNSSFYFQAVDANMAHTILLKSVEIFSFPTNDALFDPNETPSTCDTLLYSSTVLTNLSFLVFVCGEAGGGRLQSCSVVWKAA